MTENLVRVVLHAPVPELCRILAITDARHAEHVAASYRTMHFFSALSNNINKEENPIRRNAMEELRDGLLYGTIEIHNVLS
jgi:hypothetical protein